MAPVQNKEDALRLREEKIKDALRAIDEGMAIRTAGRRFGRGGASILGLVRCRVKFQNTFSITIFIMSNIE